MEKRVLLRVQLNSTDQFRGISLYEQVVLRAKEFGLAGATVKKGVMGFLGDRQISKPNTLSLSENLSVVIEIIDNESKINHFLPELDKMVREGLVTLSKVDAISKRVNK